MSRAIVVSVSVGTGLFIGCLVLMLCVAIGATLCIDSTEPTMAPAIFKPNSGAIGDTERAINDLKYGPVNLDAAKEIKNGLFARIRDTRQSRICAPVQQQACVPVQDTRVIEPQPYVIQATGIESPSDAFKEYPAVNPLEPQSGDCPTCRPSVEIEKLLRKKVSPRSENKTGAFMCSRCRKSHVGEEWHTDWAADGTPITFLCESCYSRMSSQQRLEAYEAYASRQTTKNGRAALLHQEIGE
ncbi:hypothetical protein [Flavobacterium sp.]|uniref:hypothetical protein n=1 Tax=Flavobacterium sp. TaxID=239 RepID=UPI0037C15F74